MGETYLRLNPMDLARVLRPNQQLEIMLTRTLSDAQVERVIIKAVILSLHDGTIQLLLLEEGRLWFSLFRPGRTITIHTGRSDGLFAFKSKIIRREVGDGVRIFIESPKILASKERRGGPRIPMIVPVVYRVLSFREKELPHLSDKIGTGESLDLSKGGITLLTDLQLPVGMNLMIELALEEEIVTLIGVVRRSQPNRHGDYAYSIGLQFLDLGSDELEAIERVFRKNDELFKGGISL